MKIFDALGREVTALVNEYLPAGNYSRQWNAKGASSGIYFYSLIAGSYKETKKLILLR
ncbi:MAG: T9SS type A sorting domain-containing protein [Bacteroidota bacterium]|nr:T9SS type A sorting domain-containing protein [Bacteroidota bacterium]